MSGVLEEASCQGNKRKETVGEQSGSYERLRHQRRDEGAIVYAPVERYLVQVVERGIGEGYPAYSGAVLG